MDKIRKSALELLIETFDANGYSNRLYENHVRENKSYSETDRAFLKALYFGVMRKRIYLDFFLDKKSKKPISKTEPKILNILRLGLFQILFMDRVPDYAAVDESVSLAKEYGKKETVKFVNGLLRSLLSEDKSFFDLQVTPASKIDKISAYTSHPPWMVKRYISLYGFRKMIEILEANNQTPKVNVRINNPSAFQKTDIGKMNRFCDIGMEIETGNGDLLVSLIEDGTLTPQDQSSLITASLIKRATGRVLELSAGRGNKTGAIRKFIDSGVSIISADISMNKLKELKMLNLEQTSTICVDNLAPLPFKEKFKTIFLDAPCTNLGTIRRYPEVRFRRSEDDIAKMQKVQKQMLNNASRFVDDGGRILYAVCSFEPDEGFAVIDSFLKESNLFKLVDIKEEFPRLADGGLIDDGCFRVTPGSYGMDGFFIALVEKTKKEI